VPPSVGAIARDRRGGQLALAGLLVAAFAAVAVARLSGGDGSNQLAAIASSSPSATARVTPLPATPTPVATVALTPQPSVAPSAPPSTAPTATPAAEHETYTVRSGDTLTAIARRFGTTVDAIAELNDIAAADRNKLYIGQVLLIP
jgi:LysM repeat protein